MMNSAPPRIVRGLCPRYRHSNHDGGLQAVNFYQTHGPIHGRRKIVPADPEHTTILGNFRWEYKGEPEVCHGFSWRGRLLSNGHTQIECDPQVWSQVKTLILSRLPNTVVTRTDCASPQSKRRRGRGKGQVRKSVLAE